MSKLKFVDIGEGINEGTIISWKCKPEDQVKEGDILVIIETDKLEVEIPAHKTGTIKKIFFANEGDVVRVGDVLAEIE